MSFPAPRFLDRGDARLALYEAGPEDGPLIVLVHGWPEMAYSWKNQIPVLARSGYRVIAYDLRGMGRSTGPKDVTDYDLNHQVADLAAVIDEGGGPAVICGHDWGGIIVWHAARMIADKVRGVIGINTPFVPRPPADPLAILRARYGEDHYIVRFQEPGAAEALLSSNPEKLFRQMFRRTPEGAKPFEGQHDILGRFKKLPLPPKDDLVMGEADVAEYIRVYKQSGWSGGINLYRNFTKNWEDEEGRQQHIDQPALMIAAERDLFLPPSMSEAMHEHVPNLTRHIIDCGHWTMWEAPEELNRHVLNWLKTVV